MLGFFYKKIGLIKYKQILKDQVYSLLTFIVRIISATITVKIITNYLHPEEYGLFRFVMAIVAICEFTTIPGINKSIGGYVLKGFHGTVKKSTIISIKTGLVGVFILIGFASYYYFFTADHKLSYLFLLAAFIFLPFTVFSRYESILVGLKNFKTIFRMYFILSLSVTVSIVIILYYLNLGLIWFACGQIVLQSILFTIFFIYTYNLLKNDKVDKAYLKHSSTISLVGFINTILEPGLQVYINQTLGSINLATYFMGKRLLTMAAGVVKPLMNPIVIRIAKKGKVDHSRLVIKFIPILFLIGLLYYIIFYFGVSLFGPLLIGEKFIESLYYAKILGMILVFSPMNAILIGNIIYEKNNKGFIYSTHIQQIITIIGYSLFIGKYGIIGVAIVNLISTLIYQLSMIFFIKQGTLNVRL